LFVALLAFAPVRLAAQQNSVLSSGQWYKFSVTNDGIYRIDYNQLRSVGINPDQIDPKNIRVYSFSTGMLPQANSAVRMQDLTELAISVTGEEDGKFNGQDFVLFFGQGPDRVSFNTQKQMFAYQNNLFTDKNFYFLTVGDSPGKRLGNSPNVAGSYPTIQEFDEYAFYENEKFNLLKSGREWFGEQFDNTLEATVQFAISGITANSPIKFTSAVMAQSITDCSFKVFFNNTEILTQPIAAVPNTTYAIKGRKVADTLQLVSNAVLASSRATQEIKYQFAKGGMGLSVGYLNYFLFSFKRQLAQYGDITSFLTSASLSNAVSNFIVNNTSATSVVWDITDPFKVQFQNTNQSGTQTSFSTATASLKQFVVFNPAKATAPTFELKVENQNLHALSPAQLIIITNPLFEAEANRLATHRKTKSGLSVQVVTTDQVYNEYSGGKQDFTALRDFIRDVYRRPSSSLQNVLLFGRGSYDYKNRVLNNTNYVPIYESVNSLSPLETYSSDDYFALLDDNEGDWLESPAQNSTMNIGIGRLPVKSKDEAKAVVDKLISYDTESRKGSWHKDFLFVADDGDFNIHQSQADQLAMSIDASNPEFDVKKLYLDSYNQIERNTGPFSPEAAKALDFALRKGQAIVNYTGHGSERVWMQEQVLTEQTVLSWKNAPMYPLFVTATCEFGRNDDPFIISSGEKILLQPKGGGIGLVTTARPVNSATNFTLNRAFYLSFFSKINSQFRDLGSIFRDTKNNSMIGVANRNFSLLGDPSMKLFVGSNQVIIDEVKTASGSTTLKGLSNVTMKGQIKSNGSVVSSFMGELDITLFDKPTTEVTKGNENPPFTFTQWSNILFQGKAFVTNGAFQFNFVMPANVATTVDKGKLSAYAFSTDGGEAFGFSTNFLIGGQEPAPPTDAMPPTVQLFMGDTTFVPSGLVAPNTKLVARLFDKSGINVSGINPDKSLVATLDGKFKFVVNDYYVADKDNFQQGMLTFPIDTLAKGKHNITLSASDTYDNTSLTSLDFVVSEGGQLVIEQVANYPNPVTESTQFWFTHNRPGEDLKANVVVYSLTGQWVFSEEYSIPESQYQVSLPEWNAVDSNGRKLGNGLYVIRLFVRSEVDGSNNEKSAKIILSN
jgi:hypothetical protein